MTITAPPPGLQPEDYEEIEAAVMETARGRWFLAEHGRRARAAEGEKLLAALSRIEARLEAQGALAPDESFSVAERLSELAWTLRESGVEDFVCGKIDSLAREFSGAAAPRRASPEAPGTRAPAPQNEPARATPPQPETIESLAVEEPPEPVVVAEEIVVAAVDNVQPEETAEPAESAAPAPIVLIAVETGSEPPSRPVDPRLAALSWLDRLPLVDRMALFA